MQIASDIESLRHCVQQWRTSGQKVAFVPTMGNLHQGHLSLVEKAQQIADKVVVSIFVNPTQFDRAEDLQAYPRTEEADQKKLSEAGVDLLFLPSVEVMYPDLNHACSVHVPEVANILEGASRKGHFSGVATVVAKLFNLVQADATVFGEKDFQQLMIIRQMVNDLNFSIDIVAAPTVREKDGLAMSSRNGYLTKDQRTRAGELYKTLSEIKQGLNNGERDFIRLQDVGTQHLTKQGFSPDYIEIRRQKDLQRPKPDDYDLVILAAAWLGKARLIDNLIV